MNNNAIGVIDSGVGGLTVLDKLIEKMPSENYIYIADQKNVPYGTKTNEEIKQYCKSLINYLAKQEVKAIVIACNTASTHINYLKTLTDIPLFSVIEPTCQKACELTKNKRVGIIATISTINNGKYQQLLTQKGIMPISLACSEFVDLVEKEDLKSSMVDKVISEKLTYFQNTNIDTLIYGCTHFSILESNIKKVLGSLNYVASGDVTAHTVFTYLEKNNLLNLTKMKGMVTIYTTGKVQDIKPAMTWFKKSHEEIQKIKIED